MPVQASEGLLSSFLCHKRLSAAKPYLKGRVLDFGCGSGGLAEFVSPEFYLGVDIDEESLNQAHSNYPEHQFLSSLPKNDGKFDTIVSLAVIEHFPDPRIFLKRLRGYISDNPFACIVLTTPYPSMEWIHTAGAAIGLFSKHANEEHQALLGFNELKDLGRELGLEICVYRRFLFGANQLIVYST